MSDALRRLDHEAEVLGHLLGPTLEHRLLRHPVERVVDLDRREALGVVAQHVLRRQLLRVEVALPFRVRVAAGADPRLDAHARPSRHSADRGGQLVQHLLVGAAAALQDVEHVVRAARSRGVSPACPAARRSARAASRSASVSRVPCRNSMGSFTRARCSARETPGCPAGCSGKPTNTSPLTPSSGAAAAAREVMRPPIDLPPAQHGHAARGLATRRDRGAHRGEQHRLGIDAAAALLRCTGTGSAAWRCRCAARRCAIASMNACRIPAPAPCAST